MSARVLLLVLAAAGWVTLGVAKGGLLGAGAVAIGVVTGVLAIRLRKEVARRHPAWVVAAGLAGLGLALPGFLVGSASFGAAALVAGAAVLLVGTQMSLFHDPLPEGVELPSPLSLTTNAAAAVDESLRFVWAATALANRPPPASEVVPALRAAAARHRAEGSLERPALAHPLPPALEKLELTRTQLRRVGEVEELRFESEYEARDPEVRHVLEGIEANRTAWAHLWRHGDRPRPTLICLHGYGMGRPAWDAHAWDVERWHHELGLDLVMPILPFHGPRAPGRRSGAGFLDAHPLQTNAAFGQAIWELRRLTGWLRQEGAPAIGVHGMSLGGYTAALFASLERGLACVIPSIPVVDLGGLLEADLSPRQRDERSGQGFTAELLREAWAPHGILGHDVQVPHEGRLIIGARADRICPPAHAQRLWEHWGQPAIHWTPGSHLLPKGRSEQREVIARHLETQLAALRTPAPALSRFRVRGGAAQPSTS